MSVDSGEKTLTCHERFPIPERVRPFFLLDKAILTYGRLRVLRCSIRWAHQCPVITLPLSFPISIMSVYKLNDPPGEGL